MAMTPNLESFNLPRHIAIIMDGNGRWAELRNLPRIAGHRAGVLALKSIVERAVVLGIEILTVYAFSQENWRRHEQEIASLFALCTSTLKKEIEQLNKHNVKVCFIGSRERYPDELRGAIQQAEQHTAGNNQLLLNIAFDYGGRWEITQACRRLLKKISANEVSSKDISEEVLATEMQLSDEPELFIRAGGEYRISNYMLWQMAYTELYFTDLMWPDFNVEAFDTALAWYANRNRRFGQNSRAGR